MIDAIRRQIWRKEEVKVWYRQNVCLFVRRDMLELHPGLQHAFDQTHTDQSDVVHPHIFRERIADHERLLEDAANPSLSQALRLLVGAVRRSVRHRVMRASGRQ
jgi:hypothetical protein